MVQGEAFWEQWKRRRMEVKYLVKAHKACKRRPKTWKMGKRKWEPGTLTRGLVIFLRVYFAYILFCFLYVCEL